MSFTLALKEIRKTLLSSGKGKIHMTYKSLLIISGCIHLKRCHAGCAQHKTCGSHLQNNNFTAEISQEHRSQVIKDYNFRWQYIRWHIYLMWWRFEALENKHGGINDMMTKLNKKKHLCYQMAKSFFKTLKWPQNFTFDIILSHQ